MLSKFKGWFTGLSSKGKVLFGLVAVGVLGTAAIAGSSPEPTPATDSNVKGNEMSAPVESIESGVEGPVVETKTVTEVQLIPFTEGAVNDSTLEKGKSNIKTSGVNGQKTLTYEVTLTDGVETARKLIGEAVNAEPVAQVTALGTKVAVAAPKAKPVSSCDTNYTGACVPVASDVDCAGGSGNGPAYVVGPVRVVGMDIYDLDRDGDGYGCD